MNTSPGYDTIHLRTLNNGINGTGTDLKSVSLTAGPPESSLTKFLFGQALLDGDNEPDIDFEGRSASAKTFVRVGSAATWTATTPSGADKPWSDTNGDNIYTPGADPNNKGQVDRLIAPTQDPAWTATASFTITGSNSVPVDATGFQGVEFAELVVPTGTDATFTGTLTSSVPGSPSTNFTLSPSPEPSTFGLLIMFGIAYLGRRGAKITIA